MAKFIVELFLDGYDTQEEQEAACLEFIEEQLNFSASSVKVTPIKEENLITADEYFASIGDKENFEEDCIFPKCRKDIEG